MKRGGCSDQLASYETSVLPDQSRLPIAGFSALLISVPLYTPRAETQKATCLHEVQSCRFPASRSKGYGFSLIPTVIHE